MMKKIGALLLALCLLLAAGALAEGELTMKELNATDAFAMSLKRVVKLAPPNDAEHSRYYVQQGFCTDGTYAYAVLENQTIDRCSLWKLDMNDWSVVKVAYGLEIDHGNDLTYNHDLNRLIAVHNKPNYTHISLIDPETLEVVETRVLPYKMYAMNYEPSRKQYVVGISGSYDFVILDSEFNTVCRLKGVDTGDTKQGVDSDENYIYFPQWNSKRYSNTLVVYDWEGNYINTIRVKSFLEIEGAFHVGDDWYIAFYSSGGDIYKATLEYDVKK